MRNLGFFCVALFSIHCGSNKSPTVLPIGDQMASVGVEFAVEVRATDPEGDSISFDFVAPTLPDLKTRPQKAVISAFADGVAIFRWTPTAADRDATYPVDFKVSDNKGGVTTETVQITVIDGESGSGPIFRKPLGTGTELDLETTNCVSVDVVTEDPDSTAVTIGQEDPVLEGAMLDETGPFTATWSWCPTPAQVAAQDRYMLTLSADDMVNPKSKKGFLIVLRQKQMMGCPGAAPTITHTPPAAATTNADIVLTATISDDVGLKGSPLVYYSETLPATPPNLAAMIQLSMTRSSGNAKSGTYTVSLPNPVAASAPGTKKTLYYLIIADDNDDLTGTCDHSTRSPVTGTHSTVITAPATSAGFGVCEACTSDAQCGGVDDHCITIGAAMGHFCGRACGGTFPNCPNGYNCSTSAVTSVDGKSARQCKPTVGYCGPPPMMTCVDDALEENDSRTTIMDTTSLAMTAGTSMSLSLCPKTTTGASDDDWYKMSYGTTTSSIVVARINFLTGMEYSDLDLHLVDAAGNITERAEGFLDTEQVIGCGPYVRVLTFDSAPIKPNLYDLTLTFAPDDALEPNDAKAQSKGMSLVSGAAAKTFANLRICQGNQDWHFGYFLAADKLVVDVEFIQTAAWQDLDVFLYKDDGTTVVAMSTGTISNEHFEYTVPAGQAGFYHVVVKGKNAGTSNPYTLKAKLN